MTRKSASDSLTGRLLHPERSEFAKGVIQVLDTALASGIRAVPLRSGDATPESFMDVEHRRRFLAACHRGYDKAQDTVFETCVALREKSALALDEVEFRELVLRRVVDSVAIGMLRLKDHVMARLCSEFSIHPLDLSVLRAARPAVKRQNAESRLTFALLADLTTFVHVCDVLRVDFRPGEPTLSMIELKTGMVNRMLLDQLKEYRPEASSLERIDSDPAIPERHKAQAKRMLRQEIRLTQIQEILKTDEGQDPVTGHHIRLPREELALREYGDSIEEGCIAATSSEGVSTTIDGCLHVGIGSAGDPSQSAELAYGALRERVAEHYCSPPDGLLEVYEEVRSMVRDDEIVFVVDPLVLNLHSVPTRPFALWGLSSRTVEAVLRGTVAIRIGFDLAAFIWMCRSLGAKVGLSTRQEAARRDQLLGGQGGKLWGHRALAYESCEGKIIVGERTLLRFLCDWISPADFVANTWAKHLTTPLFSHGDEATSGGAGSVEC